MPKKINQITKLQRFEAIRNILSRRGRLDKSQIDEALSHHFDFDKDSFHRTVYRDLNELVNNNEIQVHYFSKDNNEIDNFDESIHKSYKCEWSLLNNTEKIKGHGIIEKMNGYIYCSERLNRSIHIDNLLNDLKNDMICIHFLMANYSFKIQIHKEAVPFYLVLGRVSEIEQNAKSHFVEIERTFGKRTILLSIPYNTVSSFKLNNKSSGHCVFKFQNGRFLIEDLNSKNGTFYAELKSQDIDKLIKEQFHLNQTSSSLNDDTLRKLFSFKRVAGEIQLKSSALIQLGDHLQMSVIF